jgi:hypothetical protein
MIIANPPVSADQSLRPIRRKWVEFYVGILQPRTKKLREWLLEQEIFA